MDQTKYLEKTGALAESMLLTKYRVRTPLARRLANDFLTFYLQLAYSVPVCGVGSVIVWLLSEIFPITTAPLVTAVLIVVATILFIGFGMLTMCTPLAFICILAQRRWAVVSLYPAYAAVLMLGAMGIGFRSHATLVVLSLAIFAAAAFFTIRLHKGQLRKIRSEPLTQPPKVLGCGGKLHDKVLESGSAKVLY